MTLIKNDMLIFDPNEIVRLRYDLLTEYSVLRPQALGRIPIQVEGWGDDLEYNVFQYIQVV